MIPHVYCANVSCFPPCIMCEGGDKHVVANNDVMLTSYELTNVRVNQLIMASKGSAQKLEWLFDLSPKEKSIIDHRKSAFVLGRSGVGKTTGNVGTPD